MNVYYDVTKTVVRMYFKDGALEVEVCQDPARDAEGVSCQRRISILHPFIDQLPGRIRLPDPPTNYL